MKTIVKLFLILFVLQNGYSQQLVQNINDVYRIKEYETIFLNKPLKDLLKEIKPEIKTANVFNEEDISIFLFKFTTLDQQRKREGNLSDRITLVVNVKGFAYWNYLEKPKGNEIHWDPNDVTKFGDFIITRISIVPYIE